MEYNSDSKITNLQVGERTLVSYEYSHTQNDSGNESGESTGDSVENTDEQITYYGTGDDRQKVRTVTTEYKADSEDDAAVAEKTEVFYNDEKTPSYVTTVNSSGQMLNLTDNTESAQLKMKKIRKAHGPQNMNIRHLMTKRKHWFQKLKPTVQTVTK